MAIQGNEGRSSWRAEVDGDFLRRGVLLVSILLLAWSVVGLIANPDFTTGSGATSVRVLGVDFNGWHALSGFLLFAPGILAARRTETSLLFIPAAILGLVATAIWALFSDRPAGLFPFDHPGGDVILHLGSAAAYLAVLSVAVARAQRE
jgi:Domain of unknown function (DUF4383)